MVCLQTVLTSQDGIESVIVSRSDGLAVSEFKKMGISIVIISTETNDVVKARAQKLDVPCFNGIGEKKSVLLDYCKENNFKTENVIFIGNDLNDMSAMTSIGWPLCPMDAYHEIKDISKFVIQKKGGDSVLRELLEIMTK